MIKMKPIRLVLIISLAITSYILIYPIAISPGRGIISEWSVGIRPTGMSVLPDPYRVDEPRPTIPVTIYLNTSGLFQSNTTHLCWKSSCNAWDTWLNITMDFNRTHCYANITALPENIYVWFKVYAKNTDNQWLENNNTGSFFYYHISALESPVTTPNDKLIVDGLLVAVFVVAPILAMAGFHRLKRKEIPKVEVNKEGYIKKLSGDQIESIIRSYPEQSKIDFKEKLDLSNKNAKAEFIKDLNAIANHTATVDGYLFYGVRKDGVLVGIEHQYDDDSIFQQLVNSKLCDKTNFNYYETLCQGKLIGICAISSIQKRPITIRQNYEFLREGNIFIRRGSSTGIATSEEIREMTEPKQILVKEDKNFKGEIRRKLLAGEVISKIIGEYYEFLLTLPNSDWIRPEIEGYSEDFPELDHRVVHGYISIGEIPVGSPFTLDQYVQTNKKLFWEFSVVLPFTLFQLESRVKEAASLKDPYTCMIVERDWLVKDKFLNEQTAPKIKKFYFYFKARELTRILETIKRKILEMLG